MPINTSNHLKDAEKISVQIIPTASNCTSYVLKQTQGAEFGDEAEAVRRLFEASPELMDVARSVLAAFEQPEKFPGHAEAYLRTVVWPRAKEAMKNLSWSGSRFELKTKKGF